MFGYTYDITDGKFPTVLTNGAIAMEIKTQDLLKIRGNPIIRIAGDLLMTIDNDPIIKNEICDVFRLYMQQLISNEFAKLGLTEEEDCYIPYPKYFGNEINKHFKVLVNIFQNILQKCGFEITRQESDEFYTTYYFNFGGVEWLAEIQYIKSVHVISFKVVHVKTVEYMHYVQQISNEKLLKDVLHFIGVNTEEQNIIVHIGNHRILIRGFNLPVIRIGKREIVFNSFIAKKIVCEHPEHQTVQIDFDDYQLVNFNLIPMPREHLIARNTYLAEKLSQKGKV
jgi:hypothetical protein